MENRREILEMLSAGKITADEAERLIRATDEVSTGSEPKTKPKYLRITVDSNEGKDGPTKVNIRVPMQLLRAGVKLAGLIPTQAREHINHALQENGIQADITKLKPDDLEELIETLKDLSVDLDESRNKVRIFCE